MKEGLEDVSIFNEENIINKVENKEIFLFYQVLVSMYNISIDDVHL